MKIGWIGIGNMGKPMAKHIQEYASEFTVCDLNQEAAVDILEDGGIWAETPSKCAENKDVLFMSLPMPQDVEKVCLGKDGIIESVKDGTIILDASTNSLSMVKKLHKLFEEKGVEFLDCPVSGGVVGAMKKDMSIMVGGKESTYNKIKPVLDAMGDKAIYCGPVGSGTICKLSHQLFSGLLLGITTEVLTSGVKAGMDLDTLVDAISRCASAKNPPFDNWKAAKEYNFEGNEMSFFLELAAKDVRLACEMGRENKVPLDMANILEQKVIEALNNGWGRKNSGIVRKIIADRAGVDLDYAPGGFA
jgi:3-hydroxyisobutyrate dehydrogenase